MNTKTIMLLVVAPAVALVIGCVGLELITQSALGWILLAIGIGYPLVVILYFRESNAKFRNPDVPHRR